MHFIKSLAARRDGDDGFTLIELMVVVLIIAILIAIAIPTFLGARQRAQDRAAQSDLRNGLTAEKTYYTDNQTYVDTGNAANIATLKGIESSLGWGGKLTVAVSADSAGVCLQEASKSGTTFSVMDLSSGATAGTYYGKVACPAVPNSGGAIPAGFNASW